MVDQHNCDMCGGLIIGAPVRYEVKIQIYAGYDVLEISEEDLKVDHGRKMSKLLEEISERDEKELEQEIFEEFKFDLCTSCRRIFRQDPLGKLRKS